MNVFNEITFLCNTYMGVLCTYIRKNVWNEPARSYSLRTSFTTKQLLSFKIIKCKNNGR